MASVRITAVVDDMDGSPDAKPVRFSIERSHYEIDLADANMEQLYDVLAPFISKARRVRKVQTGVDDSELRAWAKSEGYEVSDRGRLPKGLREQYYVAQSNRGKAVQKQVKQQS